MCTRLQDLERQNETLQENLRKYHQEQRTLIDKVNLLQQQLSQVRKTTMLHVLLSVLSRRCLAELADCVII